MTSNSIPVTITVPQSYTFQMNSTHQTLMSGQISLPAEHMINTVKIYNLDGSLQTEFQITSPRTLYFSNVNFSKITFEDNTFQYDIFITYKYQNYSTQAEYQSALNDISFQNVFIPFTASPIFAFGSINYGQQVYVNQSYAIPITISNSEDTATGSNFQQLITFTPSDISDYINPNCQNIAFYDSNNNKLNSWIENATSSTTAGSINIWIQIPNINANGSIIIYMAIASSTTDNYLGNGNAGAHPNYTDTYGEYDNGTSVFNFYDNFAGTTLSSVWTVPSGSDYQVNDGFIATPSDGSTGSVYNSNIQETSAIIVEWNLNMSSTSYPGSDNWFQLNRYNGNSNEHFLGVSGNDTLYNNGGTVTTVNISSTGTQIFGIWNDGTTVTWYYEGNQYTDTSAIAETDYLALGWVVDATSYNFPTIYWVRTRAYPPNGVMPGITFGSISPVTASTITITPQNTGLIYFNLTLQNTTSDAVTFQIQNQTTGNYIFNLSIPANTILSDLQSYDQNLILNQTYEYSFTNNVSFYSFIVRETY